MSTSLRTTALAAAAALALIGGSACASVVWTLDDVSSGGKTEGLSYTLTGDAVDATHWSYSLFIEGINVAGVDDRGGRSTLQDLAFSLPGGYVSADLGGLAAIAGGLAAAGCNGSGAFFCFNNVAESVSGSTLSLAFTVNAASLGNYVPHMKVQWLGSANHYDAVSTDMVPQRSVPEPATSALLLAGLGAAMLFRRREPA